MEIKKKKSPQRRCVGCNETKDKRELIRVVRSPEGEVSLDSTGKKSGRGAYICTDRDCLKKAVKSKRLDRTFGCEIGEELYERLDEQLGK